MNQSSAAWVLAGLAMLGCLFFVYDIRKIYKAGGYWGMKSQSYISRDETPGQFWLQIGLRMFIAVALVGFAAFAVFSRVIH